MVDTMKNLTDCRHFVTVMLARRVLRARRVRSRQDWGSGLPTWNDLNEAAASIYSHADPSGWPALDTIKRVLEIDGGVDDVGVVLMRAGVMMKQEETT
jgi:hypothetical protein